MILLETFLRYGETEQLAFPEGDDFGIYGASLSKSLYNEFGELAVLNEKLSGLGDVLVVERTIDQPFGIGLQGSSDKIPPALVRSSHRSAEHDKDVGLLDGFLAGFVNAGLDGAVNKGLYDGGFYVIIVSESGIGYLSGIIDAQQDAGFVQLLVDVVDLDFFDSSRLKPGGP